MQSKRDQTQAHLFVMGRLSAGLLRSEPDSPDGPVSRTARGTRTGLLVGLFLGLVIALYGVVVPGGATGWRTAGTMVVVKGTGARYLYLGGALHPVLNETSAKLVAGAQLAVDEVDASSLAGTQRGAPIGIVGAPDSLPDAGQLTAAPWLACSVPAQSGQGGQSGSGSALLSLVVGASAQGTRLTPGQGLLVRASDGSEYLLWRGQRLPLDDPAGVVQALGYGSAVPAGTGTAGGQAAPVVPAFLAALPEGPELAYPDVPGRGAAGPPLAARPTRVGQLFTGLDGSRYLLTQSGLVPVDATEFDLLRGDPRTQSTAYGGAAVVAAQIGAQDLLVHSAPAAVAAAWSGAGLPTAPPTLVSPGQGQAVCADVQVGGDGPSSSVAVLPAASVTGQAPAVQPGVRASCTPADLVLVRPGGGALVRALSAAGTGSTDYLVTDGGVGYPIASQATLQQLGYSGTTPTAVPQALLDLLPTGPSLDVSLMAGGGVVSEPQASPLCGSGAATRAEQKR